MKVFVYRKKDSAKTCILIDVISVRHNEEAYEIVFTDAVQCECKFDTRVFKTTTYQN